MSSGFSRLVLFAMTCVALTGCGGTPERDSGRTVTGSPSASTTASAFATRSAKEMYDAAMSATRDVQSFSVNSSFTENGNDVQYSFEADARRNCRGSFSDAAGDLELIAFDGTQYLRAGEAYWSTLFTKEAAASIADQWVQVPAGAQDFRPYCDLNEVLSKFPEVSESDVAKGEVATVGGQPAQEIVVSDGEGTAFWVGLEGDHYLLRMTFDSESHGSMDLYGFDEPVVVEPPLADEVVRLEDLS